jgi:DNA (cytosine-5)-methyltransferase 1
MPNKPTAIELFAGAGGLSLGFEQAGFKILAATDIEPYSQKTFALNFPKVPFLLGDIRSLQSTELLSAAGATPDLLIGGPPCQGFSTLGAKISADPRNRLVDEFARLARDLQPKIVVIENVRTVTTMYNGSYSDHIKRSFAEAGYPLTLMVLDAADYGAPQHRKRAFFIGAKDGRRFSTPKLTHGEGLLPYETVGAAISDLADAGPEIPNHIALNHSEVVVRRYKLIPEGGRLPPPKDLPPDIRRSNFGNTYKRLHRERPSLTMVPGNNAFPIHPWLHRSLTPREAARIQTFPDRFVFPGERRRQCILVGNAVPPQLAQVVARVVRAELSRKASQTATHEQSAIGEVRKRTRKSRAEKYPFIDMFSGAGGFTIGLTAAGLHPLAALDNDPDVEATHRENHSEIPFLNMDASTKAAITELKALGGDNLFLLVGGPPCQGFSIFGKRRFTRTRKYDPTSDPRNQLVFAFVEGIKALRPQWVVMENVAGFASLDDGSFVKSVVRRIKQLGYQSVEWRIVNAADYGVPQQRKRFVLIANRSGHIIPWPKAKYFSEPHEWQNAYRTVGEVISDLADSNSYKRQSCHVPMSHKPDLVERYRYIKEGKRLVPEELPARLRKGYRTDKVKNFSHVFRRLDRNSPSGTLVPGHNAFPIHPWLDRAITVREAARIQTFPDSVVFLGSRQKQCIQVGNAFPPLLAQVIGAMLIKAVVNDWKPGAVPKSALRNLLDIS